MKIYPVKNFSSFRANEPLGYDDEISKNRRDYIRHHYESWHHPQIDVFEKEPQLDEYNLSKLLGVFKTKPRSVDKYLLPDDYGIRKIDSCRSTNSYRGQSLVDAPFEALISLKRAGIKTVIDLAGYGSRYEERVKKAGLNFQSYYMNDWYWERPEFEQKKKTNPDRAFIDKFIKFINKMQEDFIYIACEYGSYKTDDALILNSYFNPKANRHPTIMRFWGQEQSLENLYSNLTEGDFAKLGWTKEFDAKFKQMIKEAGNHSLLRY